MTDARNPRTAAYEVFTTLDVPLPCAVKDCPRLSTWAHVMAGEPQEDSRHAAYEFTLRAYCAVHGFAQRDEPMGTPYEEAEQDASLERFVIHMLHGIGTVQIVGTVNIEDVPSWHRWQRADFENEQAYENWLACGYEVKCFDVEYKIQPFSAATHYIALWDEENHSLHLIGEDGTITPPQNGWED